MSDVLETKVHGEPSTCTETASKAGEVRRTITQTVSRVERARSLAGSWEGYAGDSFENRVTTTARDLKDLDDRVDALQQALTDFAGELTVVKERMAEARQVASAGGVAVSGTQIHRPVAPDAASQGQVDAYNTKADAWNEAVGIADSADFTGTDPAVHGAMQQRQGVPGP